MPRPRRLDPPNRSSREYARARHRLTGPPSAQVRSSWLSAADRLDSCSPLLGRRSAARSGVRRSPGSHVSVRTR